MSFFWTDAAIKPLQLIQLALFHATINSPIPPSFYFYLIEFKRSLFSFMPNFFSSFLQESKTYHPSSQKMVDIFVDYNFLRHLGQIFIFLIVFSIIWFIWLMLSNKRLISHKTWHSMFDDVFKRRFKFMALNDVFALFYVPILYFSLNQFKDLVGSEIPEYMNANAAFTVIFFVCAVILPFVWLVMWIKLDPSRF